MSDLKDWVNAMRFSSWADLPYLGALWYWITTSPAANRNSLICWSDSIFCFHCALENSNHAFSEYRKELQQDPVTVGKNQSQLIWMVWCHGIWTEFDLRMVGSRWRNRMGSFPNDWYCISPSDHVISSDLKHAGNLQSRSPKWGGKGTLPPPLLSLVDPVL